MTQCREAPTVSMTLHGVATSDHYSSLATQAAILEQIAKRSLPLSSIVSVRLKTDSCACQDNWAVGACFIVRLKRVVCRGVRHRFGKDWFGVDTLWRWNYEVGTEVS